MKKIVSFIFVGALLMSVVALPGRKAEAQAGLVSSILSRLDKNRQSLKTLRANIDMWKYNAQLRDEDHYKGIILYIPGVGGKSNSFVRL